MKDKIYEVVDEMLLKVIDTFDDIDPAELRRKELNNDAENRYSVYESLKDYSLRQIKILNGLASPGLRDSFFSYVTNKRAFPNISMALNAEPNTKELKIYKITKTSKCPLEVYKIIKI